MTEPVVSARAAIDPRLPKTRRLEELLPEVYAARSGDGVLHHVLDAVGAQLMQVDASVKRLLVAHWLDHAEGLGLDALASTFGQRRRTIGQRDESDENLRERLRTVVARFTGGGTVEAVKGAVRVALGLPFDLDDVPVDPRGPVRAAIEQLVQLTEFAPVEATVRQVPSAITVEANRSRLVLVVDLPSVAEDLPTVTVTGTLGVARNIEIAVELGGQRSGLRADAELWIGPGDALVVEHEPPRNAFAARVVRSDGRLEVVGHLFRSLSGGPPAVPPVPGNGSTWIVSAGSGFAPDPAPVPRPPFSGGRPPVLRPVRPRFSAFDRDTFDLPLFDAQLSWTVLTPLTFDVAVPYFLQDAVQRIRDDLGHVGAIFTHDGVAREQIQAVVDGARAAGVRGRVSFTLGLPPDGAERHEMAESLRVPLTFRTTDAAGMDESLAAGSVSTLATAHDITEHVWIGGVFDISPFDAGGQGFQD